MPVVTAGKRTLIDCIRLRQILNAARQSPHEKREPGQRLLAMHVVFEVGQLKPTNGILAHWSQGCSFGIVSTMLRLSAIPATALNPKDWQKEMHLGIRGKHDDTKTASIEACRRLFPKVALMPNKNGKPHDGVADALLMAEWGRRKNL